MLVSVSLESPGIISTLRIIAGHAAIGGIMGITVGDILGCTASEIHQNCFLFAILGADIGFLVSLQIHK